jgi:heme-degrading monooxygenase HmoA
VDKESSSGANEFFLIQQADVPQHFLSFGNWDDQSAVDSWRQTPEFAERLGRCRELCDDFKAHDFEAVAHVGGMTRTRKEYGSYAPRYTGFRTLKAVQTWG